MRFLQHRCFWYVTMRCCVNGECNILQHTNSTTFFTGHYSDIPHKKTYMYSTLTCLNTELCTVPHRSGHILNTKLCTLPHQSGHILNTQLCTLTHQSEHILNKHLCTLPHQSGHVLNTQLCTVPHQSGCILPRNIEPLRLLQLFVK